MTPERIKQIRFEALECNKFNDEIVTWSELDELLNLALRESEARGEERYKQVVAKSTETSRTTIKPSVRRFRSLNQNWLSGLWCGFQAMKILMDGFTAVK